MKFRPRPTYCSLNLALDLLCSFHSSTTLQFGKRSPAVRTGLNKIKTRMDWLSIQLGKPFVTIEDVPALVKEDYGLVCKNIKEFECYDSKNFYVEVEDNGPTTETYGNKFVFKVMNSEFSKHTDAMRNCTEILVYLNQKGIHCPYPVKNIHCDILRFVKMKRKQTEEVKEEEVKESKILDEGVFMFRLFSFIPGITLKDVPVVLDNVFVQAGEGLAKIHLALREFNKENIPNIQKWNHDYPWTLDNASDIKCHLSYIEDQSRRKMAEEILHRFETEVLPHRAELRMGFLHGDYNDGNLLMDPLEGDGKEQLQTIKGVIDFDDVTYGPIVFDVGISMMYMLQCKTPTPLTAAGFFFRAYDRVNKLTEVESKVVFICAAARFVQSLVGGLYSYSFHKDPYTLCTQERGWTALELLYKKDWGLLHKEWDELQLHSE